MKIDLQDVTDTRKNLAVTLEASEVQAEEKSVLGQFSKMAKIPGFRPGKAPASFIKKKFAKQIADELKQRVTSKAYQEGSKEAKVETINIVDVTDAEISAEQDATITFTIDIKPIFELSEYKSMDVSGMAVEVTDEDVEKAIDSVRSEQAEFEPVDRPAEKGDYVKFAHEGTIDGKAISEIAPEKPVYAKMPQTWEEVGSDHGLIPGLSKELEGLKSGDSKEVSIKFPSDFTVEQLREADAVYSVEVQEVRHRKLPELDEAFFKSQQVKDLEEFKERLNGMLKSRKAQERHEHLRNQVSEKLAELASFSLPASLVDQETEMTMRQIVSDNARRGIPEDEMEKNKDEIFANARTAAEKRVKGQLILSKIAEAEKIELSNEDFSRFVMNQAYQSGQKPDSFIKEIKKDRSKMQQIQQSLLFDKTLEFLVKEAKVTEA